MYYYYRIKYPYKYYYTLLYNIKHCIVYIHVFNLIKYPTLQLCIYVSYSTYIIYKIMNISYICIYIKFHLFVDIYIFIFK